MNPFSSFQVNNIETETLVKANIEFNPERRLLGLYFSSEPAALAFDNAFKLALEESLKTEKTISKHLRTARDQAQKVLPEGVTLTDIGYGECEFSYHFRKEFE